MEILNWKPFTKGALRGFFSVTLPSGMILHDCCLFEKNGSRWVSLPSQKFTDKDGKTGYKPMVEFVDRSTADNFCRQTVQALEKEGFAGWIPVREKGPTARR